MLGLPPLNRNPKVTRDVLEIPGQNKANQHSSRILSFISSKNSVNANVRNELGDPSTQGTDFDPKLHSIISRASPGSGKNRNSMNRRLTHGEITHVEDMVLRPEEIEQRRSRQIRRYSQNVQTQNLSLNPPLFPLQSGGSDLEDSQIHDIKIRVQEPNDSQPSSSNCQPPQGPSGLLLQVDPSSPGQPTITQNIDSKEDFSRKLRGTKIKSFSRLINEIYPTSIPASAVRSPFPDKLPPLQLKRPKIKKALQDCCWAFCF